MNPYESTKMTQIPKRDKTLSNHLQVRSNQSPKAQYPNSQKSKSFSSLFWTRHWTLNTCINNVHVATPADCHVDCHVDLLVLLRGFHLSYVINFSNPNPSTIPAWPPHLQKIFDFWAFFYRLWLIKLSKAYTCLFNS